MFERRGLSQYIVRNDESNAVSFFCHRLASTSTETQTFERNGQEEVLNDNEQAVATESVISTIHWEPSWGCSHENVEADWEEDTFQSKNAAKDCYYQIASRHYFVERYEVSDKMQGILSEVPLYAPSDIFALRTGSVVEKNQSYSSTVVQPSDSTTTVNGSTLQNHKSNNDSASFHAYENVPNVAGAFVAQNILNRSECDRLIQIVRAMGFEEPSSEGTCIGPTLRRNSVAVVLADSDLVEIIMHRLEASGSLPRYDANGGKLAGINRRWRVYRYRSEQQETFRPHIDSPWPGSGLDDDNKLVYDIYGDRISRMTLLIYLNDNYEGGQTSFFTQCKTANELKQRKENHQHIERVSVKVPQGSALCFWHGNHILSPLHEGSHVMDGGTKFVIRTDVLYKI